MGNTSIYVDDLQKIGYNDSGDYPPHLLQDSIRARSVLSYKKASPEHCYASINKSGCVGIRFRIMSADDSPNRMVSLRSETRTRLQPFLQ